MADTKVSGLTAVTTPAATDEFPVNQGAASKKVTLLQIQSNPVILGQPRTLPVSASIPTGWVADIVGTINLTGSINLSIVGTGELVMTDDMAMRANLILAGRA